MWHEDLEWSKWSFQNIIWPKLNEYLEGKLDPIEGSIGSRDLDIDRQSGVDYWWVQAGSGRTAMSSRVQADNGHREFPYNTFTIRRSRTSGTKTEYQKLIEAREHRRLYPALTVQGYVTDKYNGELVSFGLAYTDKLLDFIEKNPTAINRTDNADFYIIPFTAVAHYRWPLHPLNSLMTPEQLANWERKTILNHIGQAHVRPSMNLHEMNLALAEYGIELGSNSPNKVVDWNKFTLDQLKEIEKKLN